MAYNRAVLRIVRGLDARQATGSNDTAVLFEDEAGRELCVMKHAGVKQLLDRLDGGESGAFWVSWPAAQNVVGRDTLIRMRDAAKENVRQLEEAIESLPVAQEYMNGGR